MRFRWLAVALLDLRSDPPGSLILTFMMGILAFGILSNGLFSLFTDVENGTRIFVRSLLPFIGAVVVGAASFYYYWRGISVMIKLNESSNVPEKDVVITCLSPYQERRDGSDNLGVIRDLISLHKLATSEGKQLHIISVLQVDPEHGDVFSVTPGDPSNQGVLTAYNKLRVEYAQTSLTIKLHSIYNTDSAEQSFEAAQAVLGNAGVSLDRTVIDVTAGTKAMTAGLAAAAFASGCALTYLAVPRDADGQPDFTRESKQFVLLDSGNLRTQILREATKPE